MANESIIISRVFDITTIPVVYRIKMQIYFVTSAYNTDSLSLLTGPSYTSFYEIPIIQDQWYGINAEVTITDTAHTNLQIAPGNSGGGNQIDYYIKNLQIIKLEKAEVQDSEMRGAGRRRSAYEGTKITSQDFNVNSPDTIDAGPVITVNTVATNIVTSDQSLIANNTSGQRLYRSVNSRNTTTEE